MKKALFSTLMAATLSLGYICEANATINHHTVISKPSQKESKLIVLSAVDGDIKKTNDGYTLTLQHVDPKTLWFSDRPARKAGFIPTSTLIEKWNTFFKKSSPNAAVVHTNMSVTIDGQTQPLAVELSHPQFIGSTLIFKVSLLKGDKIAVGKMHDVDLFIDNAAYEQEPVPQVQAA